MDEKINIPKLVAVSVAITDPGDLLESLPNDGDTQSWVQYGEGLVGWGEVFRYSKKHENQIGEVGEVWQKICENATIKDSVRTAGSGLVGFTTLTFAANSQTPASLLVPKIVLGKRDGVNWVTTICEVNQETVSLQKVFHRIQSNQETVTKQTTQVCKQHLTQTFPQWDKQVSTVLQKIAENKVKKVVLARKITLEFANKIDIKKTLNHLANMYPNCWTYSVDKLVGATPEMLLSVRKNTFQTKVLAGTISRKKVVTELKTDKQKDLDAYAKKFLFNSDKEQQEHKYALDSLLQKLELFCENMVFSQVPTLLTLKNVWHLESNVTGTYREGSSIFSLLEQIHPTAAVCGTPRETAAATIKVLENFDRGRYAGPVGWVDYVGNGDFGIALRGGQVREENLVDLFAGCGIVAGSSSVEEYAETVAKFLPMLQALEVQNISA